MKKDKLDLSEWKNVKLVFNKHEHNADRLIVAAGGGPLVKVEIKDLVIDQTVITPFEPNNTLTPIFYKHANKWHLLIGKVALAKAIDKEYVVLEGRLLSTPALKTSRIVVPSPDAPVAPSTRPAYNSAPPRYGRGPTSTNSLRTQAGPNTRRDRP